MNHTNPVLDRMELVCSLYGGLLSAENDVGGMLGRLMLGDCACTIAFADSYSCGSLPFAAKLLEAAGGIGISVSRDFGAWRIEYEAACRRGF
jgi:hypothetical protein